MGNISGIMIDIFINMEPRFFVFLKKFLTDSYLFQYFPIKTILGYHFLIRTSLFGEILSITDDSLSEKM